MPTNHKLALPWPAWHTDDSDDALCALWKLTDRELLAAEESQNNFGNAHSRYLWQESKLLENPSGWRLSYEEREKQNTVERRIRNEMASRFRQRAKKRIVASEVRRRLRIVRKTA